MDIVQCQDGLHPGPGGAERGGGDKHGVDSGRETTFRTVHCQEHTGLCSERRGAT